MENQHRKISGYRELTQLDIDRFNESKRLGQEIGAFIEALEQLPDIDKRWLAISKTDLQKGFMSLGRAITRPESF